MSEAMLAGDRAVLRIGGADHRRFMQDLVTNNVRHLDAAPVYAALLTPQGKYLFDFFLVADGPDALLLDVKADRAQALAQRLSLYRLRAAVTIEATDLKVVRFLSDPPPGTFRDPRDEGLGWRLITADPDAALAGAEPVTEAAFERLRVLRGVPETGVELLPDESYILEAGFDRLNGVDFRKGCYVGQEVTARMRHKTELRKGLVRVAVEGAAPPPGTAVEAGGRPVGTLFTVVDGAGLAHLRFDRADGAMMAGQARVRLAD